MSQVITPYLTSQLRLHPSMAPQDMAKLCYQAARGGEHLLADPERARVYLLRELEQTPPNGEAPLVEPISPAIFRVNLAPWKARGLSADRLFDLFAATVTAGGDGEDQLEAYLTEVGEWLAEADTSITLCEWLSFLERYRDAGYPAIHHSEAYRAAERPAYRIVRRELLAREGITAET